MNIGMETETIEFKKTTGELREGIISLSSMLNKHGYGFLYFGIKNDGTVIGQKIGDKTLRDISQLIATSLKPQIIPTITMELVDNKNIIKVEVSGNEQPYSAFGRYYIRSADEDRELSPSQLAKLLQEKLSSDVITIIPADNQNLSFSMLKNLCVAKGLTINNESFNENFGLLNPEGKYNLMAELLADKNDISIKVVTFKGKDKSVLIKRNEYGFKCLAMAMDQVLSYVEALNDTNVKLNSHQREEEQLFDFASFKEAWQNACLHTKWQLKNPPAVYLFSDRIEIISTGGLISDLSNDEFFKGISRPVNAKLQKIFGQLGFVEQTGHGVPLIINRYGQQAFDLMENFVNVVIPFKKTDDKDKQVPLHSDMNEIQEKIYDYLKDNPSSTVKEIQEAVGYGSTYTRRMMDWLKENGYLERVGSKKKGIWLTL